MSEPTREQWQQIETEIKAGRKIGAIKLMREATGCDLAEAKRMVEEHTESMREIDPDSVPTRFSGSGCGTSLILLGAIASAAWLWS